MIHSVCVVGAGRVGSAVAARLEERGLAVLRTGRELATGSAELVVLCVPDGAIAEAAARIPVGPWLAHTSGATTLVFSTEASFMRIVPVVNEALNLAS